MVVAKINWTVYGSKNNLNKNKASLVQGDINKVWLEGPG